MKKLQSYKTQGNSQSRSQSLRSPCPAERETRDSGIKRFPITGFLLFRLNCAGVNVYFKMDSSSESAYSSTFHKAIEFSLKKLGKPKLELRREQYDAIRAICFERKDALAVLPTGFRKSLIYREFLTTFEAAVSLNVIILLCLLCHPEAGL